MHQSHFSIHPLDQVHVVDSHRQRSQAVSLPSRNSPYNDVRIRDLGGTIYSDGENRLHGKEKEFNDAWLLPGDGEPQQKTSLRNRYSVAADDARKTSTHCLASKVVAINRLHFLNHITRRPRDRLV
ncbi:hypothetical protein RB195_022058 [Necator americanus]|uniref:Uncharacterized protein n=1 Tax=Necator americanus TaxID=51031 RepID=A0ABR1EDU0_NECAM